jgi:hypothetical protein
MPYDPNQPREPKGSETGGQWTGQGFRDAVADSFSKSKIDKWKTENISIAKSAPKTKPPDNQRNKIDAAYRLGVMARKEGYGSPKSTIRDDKYQSQMGFDFPEFVAFQAGIEGKEKPYWISGWRYGLISDSMRSKNFAESVLESGVSVMALSNGLSTPDVGFELFGMSGNSTKYFVSGFLNTIETGGDGEPLLLWAQITGEVK